MAAYAFPDYSAITFETNYCKGQKVYCWYLDEEKRQIGLPVEKVVEPQRNLGMWSSPTNGYYISAFHYGTLVLFVETALFVAVSTAETAPMSTAGNRGLEKASDCIPFYDLLQYGIEDGRGRTDDRPSSLFAIAAYGYPTYSVVTTATSGCRKVYCWYKDRDGMSLGDQAESAVYPEYAVHCCKRPQAIYLGISEEEIPPISYVPITDRTAKEAKYKLSHCLTLPAGERAVWLLLAELVEYYKVLGVEYFYIYVEDIDDYSQKVLKSYVESNDAEVIRFPTDNDVDFQFVAMQECLYRSRQHSRWVAFGDINDRFSMRGRAILLDVV
ncbi:hypothetical protein Q1695_005863 [Nippostrongylus brasiliensis]|nr:hypothetical protein Q1695_005863 [Nippostrongylus brasiliensis]